MQNAADVSGSYAGDGIFIPNNNTFTGKFSGHS